jgi:hypothetical protein
MTLSPGLNAAFPWLVDLFGGRQSARSIHFIMAACIAAFIVVHLLLVVLAGPFNEIRSMITGNYRLPGPFSKRVESHAGSENGPDQIENPFSAAKPQTLLRKMD